MKNLLILTLVLVMFLPVSVFASKMITDDSGNIRIEKTVEDTLFTAGGVVDIMAPILDDLFIAGGTLNIEGNIADNAFIAGGNIRIEKNIGHDAFIAGGTVDIRGAVDGDLRIAGGSIYLAGNIAGDLNAGGGTISIASGVTIGKDVGIAGDEVRILGTILRNAEINAEKLELNGVINGDLRLALTGDGKLTLGEKASVRGTIYYTAYKPHPEIEKLAPGRVTFILQTQPEHETKYLGFVTAYHIYGFFFLCIFGSLFLFLFRGFFTQVATFIGARPGKSLLNGILYFILLPLGSVILLMTIIGIPFGIFGIILTIFSFVFSKLITVIILSALIINKIEVDKKSSLWKNILVIVGIALILTFIGWIDCILALFAFGGIVGVIVSQKHKGKLEA